MLHLATLLVETKVTIKMSLLDGMEVSSSNKNVVDCIQRKLKVVTRWEEIANLCLHLQHLDDLPRVTRVALLCKAYLIFVYVVPERNAMPLSVVCRSVNVHFDLPSLCLASKERVRVWVEIAEFKAEDVGSAIINGSEQRTQFFADLAMGGKVTRLSIAPVPQFAAFVRLKVFEVEELKLAARFTRAHLAIPY